MPVKILHIVGDSKFGGASLGILRLAAYWQSVGWKVEIMATDPEFSRAAAAAGLTIVPLDTVWREIRPFRDLVGLIRLVHYLRSNPYTVVHTHTTKVGFVGRIAAALAGIPIIIHTAHGFAFHEASSRLRIATFTVLERIASFGCDKVITVSHFHARWGERLGIAPMHKIEPIPNGIPDPGPAKAARGAEIRGSIGIPQDSIMLLTPGRLAPEKGLEDLIEAFKGVAETHKSVFLVLAGDGALRQPLCSLVERSGFGERVKFLGFRHDIADLLGAADIVVLPTWREGLSIALLEAMASGCAIITTDIGPNREATRDGVGALLVPPRSPGELRSAMVRLLANEPLQCELRVRARNIYVSHYQLSRMLDSYQKTYQKLIQEKVDANTVSPVLSSPDRG